VSKQHLLVYNVQFIRIFLVHPMVRVRFTHDTFGKCQAVPHLKITLFLEASFFSKKT